MTRRTKQQLKKDREVCLEMASERQGKKIMNCRECDYLEACWETYLELLENHRQPNGRFGKLP